MRDMARRNLDLVNWDNMLKGLRDDLIMSEELIGGAVNDLIICKLRHR